MQTIDQPEHRIADARHPLWFGQMPAAWGDTLRTIDPSAVHDAAGMIAAAGLDWSVERHPLEAVISREYQSLRLPVPRHVATVRRGHRNPGLTDRPLPGAFGWLCPAALLAPTRPPVSRGRAGAHGLPAPCRQPD